VGGDGDRELTLASRRVVDMVDMIDLVNLGGKRRKQTMPRLDRRKYAWYLVSY
jgi:hypothetical protein